MRYFTQQNSILDISLQLSMRVSCNANTEEKMPRGQNENVTLLQLTRCLSFKLVIQRHVSIGLKSFTLSLSTDCTSIMSPEGCTLHELVSIFQPIRKQKAAMYIYVCMYVQLWIQMSAITVFVSKYFIFCSSETKIIPVERLSRWISFLCFTC